MSSNLNDYWYQKKLHPLCLILLPLSWLFRLCVSLRRKCYASGLCKVQKLPVPVIVVGNITVGGTGKTPLVIWLAQFLQSQGYRPGIVSRGVGGEKHFQPYLVKQDSLVAKVGDEALLLAQNTTCPLVICINRVAAAEYLLQHTDCNIIISDDGLQHYRLGRALEIAVVDGSRRFGNQQLLPAGPLREPIDRLNKVDFVLVNNGDVKDKWVMQLAAVEFVSVKNPAVKFSSKEFPYQKVHALAAIGNPERFFLLLSQMGIEVLPHVYPDHYLYQASDILFEPKLPIVMTEKDAVKCRTFCREDCWFLKVDAKIDDLFKNNLLKKLGESHANK